MKLIDIRKGMKVFFQPEQDGNKYIGTVITPGELISTIDLGSQLRSCSNHQLTAVHYKDYIGHEVFIKLHTKEEEVKGIITSTSGLMKTGTISPEDKVTQLCLNTGHEEIIIKIEDINDILLLDL